MTMTKEEKLIFKYAGAKPYGIYCDVEVSPIDPEYCWDNKGCHYDDASSQDVDDIFEWIVDYHEDSEEMMGILKPYYDITSESEKWDFIENLEIYHSDIIPDGMSFYYYQMERRLVGVCFTWNEALRLKKLYDPKLRPHIEILSRSDIKGHSELVEISEYFRNKAKEIF